jgi:hypothetical protein
MPILKAPVSLFKKTAASGIFYPFALEISSNNPALNSSSKVAEGYRTGEGDMNGMMRFPKPDSFNRAIDSIAQP